MNYIDEFMKRMGWSESDLARELGESKQNINNWRKPESKKQRRLELMVKGLETEIMKTYTFYWADGEVSSESFNSEGQVYEYLSAIEDDGAPPIEQVLDDNGCVFLDNSE